MDSIKEKGNSEQPEPSSLDKAEHSGSPSEGPVIRWLCYEEYPLSDPGESDPESAE